MHPWRKQTASKIRQVYQSRSARLQKPRTSPPLTRLRRRPRGPQMLVTPGPCPRVPEMRCPLSGPDLTEAGKRVVGSGTHAVGPGSNRAPTLMMFLVSPRVPASQGAHGTAVLIRCAGVLPGQESWRVVALEPWLGGVLVVPARPATAFYPAHRRFAPENATGLLIGGIGSSAHGSAVPCDEDRPHIQFASCIAIRSCPLKWGGSTWPDGYVRPGCTSPSHQPGHAPITRVASSAYKPSL